MIELKADEKVQKAIERRLRKGSHKVQVMHEGTTERDLEYVGPSTGLPISKAPKYRVSTNGRRGFSAGIAEGTP